MKLGFIGLGHMGAAMAANLVKAGHEVTRIQSQPREERPRSSSSARTRQPSLPRRAAAKCVITMLADDEAAADIAFGKRRSHRASAQGRDPCIDEHDQCCAFQAPGAGARAGRTALCRRAGVRATGDGGGGQAVHRRRGRARAPSMRVSRCSTRWARKPRRSASEPSAANLVKLSGNFLLASAIEALGEAIALIGKAGIDRRAYVDFLTSTMFTAPAYRIFGGLIAEGKFEPAAFAAPLGYKDIRLALAAAESLRVPMPLGSLLHDRFLRAPCPGRRAAWIGLPIGGLATQDAGDAIHVVMHESTTVSSRLPHARHSPYRAEPALHVHRVGPAHSPHRHARRTAHAGRYLSEHQHPDHRRGLSIPGLAARPDGGAHHHAVRARADDDGQRHRAHRGEFVHHFRHRQDILSPVRQYRHRQRAGHGDLADHAQADAGRHDAAADHSITAPRRCRSSSSRCRARD